MPSVVPLRGNLISRWGENKYKGLYSLTALAGLVLITYGWIVAEYEQIWIPPHWTRNVATVAMLASFYLLAAAEMKSNIKRFIRHPMLLGVLLWSLVHLLANGDLASIVLFGSFAIYCVVDIISANARGATAQKEKHPLKNDLLSVVIGLIAYSIFVLLIHPYVIGMPIV